ncbi:sulfurtransferase [Methylophaga sp. 42_25_T18]|nr:sulfurtransferase [Methylophaga sp. 42_25_T18]OUR86505.1 sulfurtransferase [Methylophaga sp. 42_8_T64]
MENLSEFIVNHWILVTLFVVLSWLVFSDAIHQKISGILPVGTVQAIQLVNQQKGLFVDIRDAEEFKKEHIADSTNIPLSTLTDGVAKLKNPAQPIILVCASGQRSRTAAKQMRNSGFTEVYVLKGGLNTWKDAKLPLFS